LNPEIIIRTLENNGRLFCREIAKAAGVENSQAISVLLELEKQGRVYQRNGYWSPACAPASPEKTKRTYTRKAK
jgi:DNA-binding IclR family transcriptional regulator